MARRHFPADCLEDLLKILCWCMGEIPAQLMCCPLFPPLNIAGLEILP